MAADDDLVQNVELGPLNVHFEDFHRLAELVDECKQVDDLHLGHSCAVVVFAAVERGKHSVPYVFRFGRECWSDVRHQPLRDEGRSWGLSSAFRFR